MIYYRTKEIAKIMSIVNNEDFASILLYGQQGVGKTTVLKKISDDANLLTLYFECKKVSNFINLELLTRLIKDTFKDQSLVFPTTLSVFDFLLEESLKQKMIVIFDEFANLFDDVLFFAEEITKIISLYKEKSKMKFIFASSSKVALIERMINFKGQPFSQFDYIFHIKPLNYLQASLFYPNYSTMDKIKMYSVFGGLPSVNALINPNVSADQNIIDLIVKNGSLIERKVLRMIQSETSRAGSLNDLLYIISQGYTKYKDINTLIVTNNGTRPDYLVNRLIDLNIINKTSPINDLNNAKRMNYEINDNLINFYYRYIFSNPFSLKRNKPELFFNEYIKNDLETNYIPNIFNSIVKDYLYYANINNTNDYLNLYIGPFLVVDKKTKEAKEFSVATYNKNGYTIYLTKYSSEKLTLKEIEDANILLNASKIKNYQLALVSTGGIENNNTQYLSFNIDDLYHLAE